ncbi:MULTISPECIES: GGDEF domain-containing protein [unclassified Acinetobacter]|uniref:GGDEF domain-containing protein n=1 Tax=unclassified Acinetobacter TaxID=196816 RepID=UPI0015D2428D|nr:MULTISPECIES: GGDEF domain-containing protein [unclassified Acinetobacter]
MKFHLFETDNVFIYWPDFNKGILLLVFALLILLGHLGWYVVNYESAKQIWFSQSYHDERIFTTWCQIFLTAFVLLLALAFKGNAKFRYFMGWFIPLFFGLLLLYSAKSVGLYSPASMVGILNILLIGFVIYKPKVIYSIMVIVTLVFGAMCYFTAIGTLAYAPLFSDQLNQSDLYSNSFWLKSMFILYSPILITSALFFEILLRQWRNRDQKIEILSRIDGLTGVYNRRYLSEFVNKRHQKNFQKYSMILLDLDHFKKINDSYGHEAGDLVLRLVAHVLRHAVREQDKVGRFGGEEFSLVLADQDLSKALEIAERCRQAIEALEITLPDQSVLKVTASFGIATAHEGMSMDEVTRLADQALYKSKENGRNQVQFSVLA